MKNKYILDACALIALLNRESGYEEINHLLLKAELGEISVCINLVNLLEVYYDRIKISNLERADIFLETIYNSSIEILEQQNKEIVRNAGRLKANYKMSLADSFVLSTAIYRQAVVVTADHHEFDKIEQNEDISFLWIR
ncbi:MAG: type II toxin-antitoxin system VapC family toxin [Fibromonadaceae bacterium]|jgi:PIN domain nuclease of toxin-antitoxin system|nr:type II toxin-antitoxin system VapC family toxin [Fibromonadaceae bacterium]